MHRFNISQFVYYYLSICCNYFAGWMPWFNFVKLRRTHSKPKLNNKKCMPKPRFAPSIYSIVPCNIRERGLHTVWYEPRIDRRTSFDTILKYDLTQILRPNLFENFSLDYMTILHSQPKYFLVHGKMTSILLKVKTNITGHVPLKISIFPVIGNSYLFWKKKIIFSIIYKYTVGARYFNKISSFPQITEKNLRLQYDTWHKYSVRHAYFDYIPSKTRNWPVQSIQMKWKRYDCQWPILFV